MGCWNGTCMVSKLPIQSNEKIKLIILLHDSTYIQPCLLPLSGEYNDFGGIKNITKDENYNIVYSSLKEFFGNTISFDDDRTNKLIVDYTLEDIINRLDKINYYKLNYYEIKKSTLYNRVRIPDADRRYSEISTIMIREDIWNFSINNYTEKEKVINRFNNSFNLALEYYEIINKRSGKDYRDFTYTMHSENFITDSMYFESMVKNNDNNIKEQWMEFSIISSFIEAIRLEWHIPAGSGSQHTGFENYKLLSSKIIEICDNYNK